MSKSKADDVFNRVLEDADALHKAAIDAIPQKLSPAVENLFQNILRHAKARPLMALATAAALGFTIASLTAR